MSQTEEKKTKETVKENNKKEVKEKEPELSEEDKLLKQNIENIVERIQSTNTQEQKQALETLKDQLKQHESLTQIPKPLKFLRAHYETLSKFYSTMNEDTKVKNLKH